MLTIKSTQLWRIIYWGLAVPNSGEALLKVAFVPRGKFKRNMYLIFSPCTVSYFRKLETRGGQRIGFWEQPTFEVQEYNRITSIFTNWIDWTKRDQFIFSLCVTDFCTSKLVSLVRKVLITIWSENC